MATQWLWHSPEGVVIGGPRVLLGGGAGAALIEGVVGHQVAPVQVGA